MHAMLVGGGTDTDLNDASDDKEDETDDNEQAGGGDVCDAEDI